MIIVWSSIFYGSIKFMAHVLYEHGKDVRESSRTVTFITTRTNMYSNKLPVLPLKLVLLANLNIKSWRIFSKPLVKKPS